MKSAMRFITVIIILLLFVSCAPTEAKVQEAIMQTQAAQPTPEYCGQKEYEIAGAKILAIIDKFSAKLSSITKIIIDVDWQSERIEFTKIQLELGAIEVPECLVKAKQLLADSISDIIVSCGHMQTGSFSQVGELADSALVNMALAGEQLWKLDACMPNCKP
jgi:hypothetical protein